MPAFGAILQFVRFCSRSTSLAGVRAQDGSGSTPFDQVQISGNPKKRDVAEFLRKWDMSAVQPPPLADDSSSIRQQHPSQHQMRTHHHNAPVRSQQYAKSKSTSTNTNSSSASLYVSAVASNETKQRSSKQ
eukprot:CAMPEP_0116021202 /NCGR_PEP_ID=MMETSP0321-20121206/10244_1 /TAXON_ID=163516 /ORGANISM="Leptocylindrus danicus var. danicus, Strain B650" /LENGTH=130 /DNA_ID=CAMNT_0003492023 /DNA_START=506 /DNA_END=898 /DNA_ORIENTATION=+